jgi:hypothetical protein
MMAGFDPTEIRNPKKTADRRMAEADGASTPAGSPAVHKTSMSQSDFTGGSPSVRAKDDAKKSAKFLELMKAHQR